MKRKLLSVALLAISALGFHANAEDVTSTYLKNADFSLSTPTDNHICGYGHDMEGKGTTYYGLQPVTDWEIEVVDGEFDESTWENAAMAGGVFAYGSEWELKGNNVGAPATNPNGEATGNSLGYMAVWSKGGYYYQEVELPAGSYKMTVPTYCQSGTQANTSYTGFIADNDGPKYVGAINTTVGEWQNIEIEFTLQSETKGRIALGYLSTGGNSAANPHLFFDNVTLEYTEAEIEYPMDMTAWINNPEINGSTGWTTERPFGGNGPLLNNVSFEYWAGNLTGDRADASFDYYQVIEGLPAGKYTISAEMYNSLNGEGGSYTVFSPTSGVYATNSSKITVNKLVDVDGTTLTKYTTGEIVVVDGTLRIGVKNFTTPMAARWFVADNFVLTLVASADYTDALEEVVQNAQSVLSEIEGHVPAVVLKELETAINDNNKSYGQNEEYAAAIANIATVVEKAQSLVISYDAYQAAKAKANAIKSQEVWSDKDDAEATYTAAISAADKAVEDATTPEEITPQADVVIAAVKTFISTVEINSGKCFDLTGFIQNAGLDDTSLAGWEWSTENGKKGPNNVAESCAELYDMDFDFYQIIPSMPAGNYELKVQAFQRPGAYKDIDANTPVNAFIYINSDEKSTTIKNVMSEWSETGYFTEGSGVGPFDYEADGKYYPDGMTGSRRFFDAGYYDNTVLAGVAEGDLRFGFKCEDHTPTAWTIFDNFRLYYYGTSINVEISEDETFAVVSDIENANVTLTRTLSTENWNTFAVPFDITEEELTEQFGADVKIATYSETAEDDNSTVTFTEADELAVTANVPVLIQTPNVEGTEFTFSGKTIKAGSAVAEGEGNFDFVGSYSTITLAAGDYFIKDSKLYEVGEEAAVTLQGTRAYIKAKAGSANIRSFVIGGETVTAIDGIAVEGVEADGAIYNVAGQQVSKEYKGIVIKNGKKYLNK